MCMEVGVGGGEGGGGCMPPAAHILFSIASRNAIQNTVIAKQFPN